MKQKKQKSDIIIDARGAEGNARLADYCRNLPRDQWDYTIMAMFPLWIRYHFHCPKQQLMALLNT